MLARWARIFWCLMKYRPAPRATALRPFNSAFSLGKKIHCCASAGDGWCTYRSQSRNPIAAALDAPMAPTARRSLVGEYMGKTNLLAENLQSTVTLVGSDIFSSLGSSSETQGD